MKATLVKDFLPDFAGHAALYAVDPPMDGNSTVIVSAASAFGVPETYIFPASADGKILDWLELGGSYQGETSHELALQNAGYELVVTQ